MELGEKKSLENALILGLIISNSYTASGNNKGMPVNYLNYITFYL